LLELVQSRRFKLCSLVARRQQGNRRLDSNSDKTSVKRLGTLGPRRLKAHCLEAGRLPASSSVHCHNFLGSIKVVVDHCLEALALAQLTKHIWLAVRQLNTAHFDRKN
jgi:hypothetical protein